MNHIQGLISVIIPVYNAHNYLRTCIESVLNQTYKKIEIFLIDDGSVDDSFQICQEYAQKDSRIKCFHKKNEGQASARNFALNLAKGEYIGFVDDDDWIYPNMYEVLKNLLEKYNADISRCDDISDLAMKKNEKISIEVENRDLFFTLTYCDILGGHVTDRLFRRSIVGNNVFPKSKTIEDMRFMRQLLPFINSEVHTSEKLYFYTIREDSTSFRYAKSFINGYERAIEFQDRYNESKARYPKCKELLLIKSVTTGCGVMHILIKEHKIKSNEFKNMLYFMRKNKKEIISCSSIPLKYRLFVMII